MRSHVRWLIAVAVGLLASTASAAPVPVPSGDKAEPPTLTFHTLPGEKVTGDIKALMKLLGGDDAVKQMDGGWAGFLVGKNTPLDLTRPVAGYLYLRANLPESSGVLVLPTADEKTALKALEGLQLKATEQNGAPGRYKLSPPNDDFLPMFVQFADGGKLAYIAVNAKPDLLDRDKLIPVGKLIDPKAATHVTATVYPDRVPAELRKMVTRMVEDEWLPELERLEQRKPRDMPAGFPPFVRELLSFGKRNLTALYAECEKATVGLHLTPRSGDIEITATFAPKSNTPLATAIAAVKGPVGRFHQLLTKDSVLGGLLALPTLPKEVREKGGQFLADWIDIAAKDAPGDVKPLFDAVAAQVKKAVADGTADAGFALAGPNKAGKYTGVAAVAFADTAGIDKSFRAAAKAAGEFVKLDAGKLGDLSVHEINAKPAMTPDLARVFGEEPKLRLVIAKDAVYAAVGDDGEAELKRALALKPAAGPAFDLTAHGARGVKLITPAPFNQPMIDLGNRLDGFLSYVALDVTGGKELRVKAKSAALLLGFFAFSSVKVGPGGAGAVPPPPPQAIEIKKN